MRLDTLDAQMKQYGAGGQSDKYEFVRGANRLRILNFPAILATHFIGGKGGTAVICVGIEEGCQHHKDDDKNPSLKLVTYVIDRKDGKIKLAELPLSVRYALKDLQDDEDYSFDDFPMPYDVKITSDPDNTDPKAKYRLVGSPNRVPLTADEQKEFEELMSKMTPEKYVEKRKAKTKVATEFNSLSTQEAPQAEDDDYPESAGEIPF